MPTIVDSAKLENNGSKPIKAHSNLTPNYNLAGTYRFGENGICMVTDTVPDDTTRYQTGHELRSMNLEAPLMGTIKMAKDYFEVPIDAILPENGEKLMKQPNKGDDINAQEVGTNIEQFYYKFWNKSLSIMNIISGKLSTLLAITEDDWAATDSITAAKTVGEVFQIISAIEKVLSKGSLSAALGKNVGNIIRYRPNPDDALVIDGDYKNIDQILEKVYEEIFTTLGNAQGAIISEDKQWFDVQIDGKHYEYKVGASANDPRYLSNRQLLEKTKEGSDIKFWIFNDGDDIGFDDFQNALSEIADILTDLETNTECSENTNSVKKDINIKNEIAYQLVNAEYFTNSHIDYTYSAELWRQMIASLLYSTDEGMGLTRDMFNYNGTDYYYDILSAHSLNKGLFTYTPVDLDYTLWYDLVNAIFGYRRSLRYKDYFVGGRTSPLAVGDLGIKVNDGYVNVVESIEKTWAARFLNQVNRIGNKSVDYFKGLFPGLVRHRDFHEPIWLAQVTDEIYTEETSNTGAEQFDAENSTNAVLRSSGNKYCFEFTSERYGVLIGIVHFEITRYYGNVIERPNFWVDRNDYFNPYLQFVGDQNIYSDELNARYDHAHTFAYTGRYKEYRDRVDQCFGGLSSGRLKGWLFEAEDYEAKLTHDYISPDYIRSRPSELDAYYSKLTGYAMANYFHFIIINRNTFSMDRPMVADPQIW